MNKIAQKSSKIMVFSGARPTGSLHLGNYLGAIKGYLSLQEKPEYDCIYAVVDLHGITSPFDPHTYPQQVRELVIEYLACGLDPQKAHLIIQSHIPEHLELSYLFATIYPVSRLEQLPTYKEKKKNQPRYINLGLLYYPVLMAADILLYKAQIVPVGEDQLPHLEVTREIARKFNSLFGKVFPEPQAFLTPSAYVPSLTGEGKMSKTNSKSYISLLDDLPLIKKKLAGVPTDIGKGKQIPQSGGVATLFSLTEIFLGEEKRKEVEKMYLSKGVKYSLLKEELAQAIYKFLEPLQEKRQYFLQHPKLVDSILTEGEEYARKIAKATLQEVKERTGIK